MIQVVELASQSIDVNFFVPLQSSLLPPEAAHFTTMNEIPLFPDRLDFWKSQVLHAFREVIIQAPQIISESLEHVIWTQGSSLLRSSNTSGTDELISQVGDQLRQELLRLVRSEIELSQITWALILDRYSIWQRATSMWGWPPLAEVSIDPSDHLSELFVTTYLRQLGVQEERLRTTPVIRGSGSFLELFQQDGR